MEPHTQALEIVCSHFKSQFGDQAYDRMRKQKAKAHHENHRLRHKIAKLNESLRLARIMIQSQAETRQRFERTVLQVLMLFKNSRI